MIGKRHDHLLRDIQNYCDVIQKNGLPKNGESAGQRKIAPSDFFIQSTYINSQNKEQPCYLLTKKGCDMVANKMTGGNPFREMLWHGSAGLCDAVLHLGRVFLAECF